jgi:hypothetical protein
LSFAEWSPPTELYNQDRSWLLLAVLIAGGLMLLVFLALVKNRVK